MSIQASVPGPSSLPLIVEESELDEGNLGVIPEMELIENCELMFPSCSVRMKKEKTSSGKDKEVMGVKTMLSGIETVTDWSWDLLMDGFSLSLFQVKYRINIQ